MSGMSAEQARVVDPVLSNHARGYTNAEFIGHLLFPYVPVFVRGGRRIEFNRDAFRLFNTRRAPGADTDEVEFGYLGQKFAVEQNALDGKVPFEIMQEAERVPGIDMGQSAVNQVFHIIGLGLEYEQASLARNAANYGVNNKVTLAGTDMWNDPLSDPKGDVKTGKEAVRSATGRFPNTLVLSPAAFSALDDHPTIQEKFKYTSSDSITVEMLAKYFDVERVVVGKAVYSNDGDGFTDVWGNDAVLAWVPTQGQAWNVPSYGYTYRLNGMPIVETPWMNRKKKSWIYPCVDESTPELVGAEAGFLIQNAATAVN